MDFPRKGKEMKKLLFALSALAALTLLAPAPGSAYDNILGIMFTDPAAYSVDNPLVSYTTGTAVGLVQAYVVLINPSVGAVYGYEMGFTTGGGAHLVVSYQSAGPNPIDVGGGLGNHIVGFAGPMAITPGGATLLGTINVFYQDVTPVTITLAGTSPSSLLGEWAGYPAILGPSDLIVIGGTSTAFGEVTGVINSADGSEIVATDEVSWDSVKSLYR